MKLCSCGSNLGYLNCCGLYIEGKAVAGSPEILMRSRYTAYTLAKIAYIKQTMLGNALNGFNAADAKRWARRVKWIGLRVLNVVDEHADKGFVEFIASFREGGRLQSIHEISEFNCINGVWYYVGGTHSS